MKNKKLKDISYILERYEYIKNRILEYNKEHNLDLFDESELDDALSVLEKKLIELFDSVYDEYKKTR